MATLITTTGLVTATDILYDEPTTGTFPATRLVVGDTSGMFFFDDSGTLYTGSIRITEALFDETVRILYVESATDVVVEQLTNTASYTTAAYVKAYGYDGTPGVAETAAGAIDYEMYPSIDKAAQGVNKTRDDIKTLNDSINVASIFIRNISQGCILQTDLVSLSTIKIVGTTTTPVIFGRETNLFLEDAEKSLDLTTVTTDGFVDIYINEDTGDTPVQSGTLPIELVGKDAGTTPFSTAAIADQYLIGCAYIYDSVIIGLYSLETPNVPTITSMSWTDVAFGFKFSGTEFTYNTNRVMYIPAFVDSIMQFDINGQLYTDGTAVAVEVNSQVGIKLNDDAITKYAPNRVSPLATNTKIWRGDFSLVDSVALTAGLNTVMIAGRIGSATTDADYSGIGKTFNLDRLTCIYRVYGNSYIYNSEV